MEYIAEIKNVSKKFGDETVVREVSLSLEQGKIYGIAGRNGSGKTVLFKMIIGFETNCRKDFRERKRDREGYGFCGGYRHYH